MKSAPQQTELLRQARLAAHQAGLEQQGASLWLSGYHAAKAEDADLLAACEVAIAKAKGEAIAPRDPVA